MHVMLKKTWPGNFRRTVRDAEGQPRRVLEFAPGAPVELTEEEAAAVADDIGPALVPVMLDEKQRPRVLPLREAPADGVERTPVEVPLDGTLATLDVPPKAPKAPRAKTPKAPKDQPPAE